MDGDPPPAQPTAGVPAHRPPPLLSPCPVLSSAALPCPDTVEAAPSSPRDAPLSPNRAPLFIPNLPVHPTACPEGPFWYLGSHVLPGVSRARSSVRVQGWACQALSPRGRQLLAPQPHRPCPPPAPPHNRVTPLHQQLLNQEPPPSLTPWPGGGGAKGCENSWAAGRMRERAHSLLRPRSCRGPTHSLAFFSQGKQRGARCRRRGRTEGRAGNRSPGALARAGNTSPWGPCASR